MTCYPAFSGIFILSNLIVLPVKHAARKLLLVVI